MTKLTYEQQVWLGAVGRAEDDVIRVCPSLCGGRKLGETVESYAVRGITEINRALERLALARKHYKAVGGKP